MKIIEGYIEDKRFIMQRMNGYEVNGVFKSEGLRSLERLIQPNKSFNYVLEKNKYIIVPAEIIVQLKEELNNIANTLDGYFF